MIDAMFRLAYRSAYQLMRVYWAVRRPLTHGSLVAIWVNERILLVRNSYVRYFSLPGGYVKSGESGKDAAIRELREEIGLYQLNLDNEPRIEVDHREVVAAAFYSPSEALGLQLFAPLRQHIEQKLRGASGPSAPS